MNNNERNELTTFPVALDKALMDKFGPEIQAKSYFNIFSWGYVTDYIAEGELKEKIELYMEAYLEGNHELCTRLYNLYTACKK